VTDDNPARPEPAVTPDPPAAGGSEQPSASGKPREPDKPREAEATPAGEPGPERNPQQELAGSISTFVNNRYVFNGTVEAAEGVFGASIGLVQDGTVRKARTGRLADEEIAAQCDHFAEPPLFRAAAEALKRDQVVVLTGGVGLGKTASAVSLLRLVTTGPLAILSPTITLRELTRQDLDAGHGYLVEDWQNAGGASDSGDFMWRVLRDHVKDSGIHLVITATAAKTAKSVTHIAWQAPSTEQVLAAYLAGTEAEPVAAEIAAAIPVTYDLDSVAAIARRLAAGEDRPAILQELSQDPARYVSQWLSADERTDEEIGEVTALSFAVGQSERIYEVMLKRLVDALIDVGLLPDPDREAKDKSKDREAAGDDDAPRPAGLRRRRAGRVRPDGLLTRDRFTAGGTSREIVAFKMNVYHRHTLEELWRGFDMTFWGAVRDWLADLIGDTTVVLIRDAAVQVSVAAGLALLARVALDEVEELYLDPWAAGALGWSGQQTAVYMLWWMSRDSLLAPVALRIATEWVNSGDPAGQWTAATALSGELGAVYPVEAARRVWHLVGQSKEVRPEAIFALANLFATLTREGEGQAATEVLDLLRKRLDPAAGQDSQDSQDGQDGQDTSGGANGWSADSWRDDRRNRERAMLAILAVLAIRDPVTGRPSVTSFLNAHPEHRCLVAELWAVVLRNRVYRRRALVSLLTAVRGFGDVSDDPECDARALGDALSEALPVAEHQPLKNDFTNLHTHSKRRESDIAATVRALLSALEHLNHTKREAE
jgi:hypothetical protein